MGSLYVYHRFIYNNVKPEKWPGPPRREALTLSGFYNRPGAR